MRTASFVDELAPFLAMEVMERGQELARSGADVLQLGVGEPEGGAPPAVIAAAVHALQSGDTHYTASRGLHELCTAIADDCQQRRGRIISPERVIVTNGTSPALLMALQLLLEPGDEVLVPTPYYPCYPNMIAACGARPRLLPTSAHEGFRIDPRLVRDALTPRTRCLLLASPANPTGAVQPRDVVEELATLGVPLLSDEIYDGLVYDGQKVTSPLTFTDDCFVFDGFSKRYAMTGFRLGYVIAPRSVVRPLQSMQQNFHISAASFTQRAALAALREGASFLNEMRGEYARRRDLLVKGLLRLGFGVPSAPQGAFYVLADARFLGDDSMSLALQLLEQAHVAVAPGRDFGASAEGYLRFSFAAAPLTIERALARIERFVEARTHG